jgi:hypothetical protein
MVAVPLRSTMRNGPLSVTRVMESSFMNVKNAVDALLGAPLNKFSTPAKWVKYPY